MDNDFLEGVMGFGSIQKVGDKPASNFEPNAVQFLVKFGLISIDVKNNIAFVSVGLCNLSEQEAIINVHGMQFMRQRKGLSPEVQPFAMLSLEN
jgi:hypothetical protein